MKVRPHASKFKCLRPCSIIPIFPIWYIKMGLIISWIFLLLGLFLLWKSGNHSIHNAIRASILFKIESFAIGFFLFAISTSLPEIISAIVSSIKKVPELSAGDLMGSTLANISLLLGICALIAKKLPIEEALRSRIFLTMILCLAILATVLFFPLSNPIFGGILIAIYLISFWAFQKQSAKNFTEELSQKEDNPKEKLWVTSRKLDVCLKLGLSLSFLILSAWMSVLSAIFIAKSFDISPALIGGTIIAVGTGLPELTLEIHAIKRKEYSLALGDIFGSSLANVTLILGILLAWNTSVDLSIGKVIFPFSVFASLPIFYRLYKKTPFQIKDGIFFLFAFVFYCIRILSF